MSMSKPQTVRRDTLNLRIKSEERGLIDRAATITGKTRTDFVLARLDEPPQPNERLLRTIRTLPPWK